jgi:ecdysone 20-monooxygenase
MLRSAVTPELTSAKTVARFLPELNQMTEDFISLLRRTRDKNGLVSGFEEVANRMGMESELIVSI